MRKMFVWIVLLLACLMMAAPSAAQDDNFARARFANLVEQSSSLTIRGRGNAILTDVGSYGKVTDYINVPRNLTQIGYNMDVGPSHNAGIRPSEEPFFNEGHDYLVLVLGTSLEINFAVINLTDLFGDPAISADQSRLLLLYYVGDIDTSMYTIEGSTETTSVFMVADPNSIDPELASAALALAPGDYQINVTDATDPEAVIGKPVTVTLEADQTTVLVIYGSAARYTHTYLFSGDELQLIGEKAGMKG